ncbi:MAG: DUF2442 domain-containing protein [Ignavibacteriae bacterium]|nr:DUF2442 domain-containing protein [Ignavibacteriota bacterium]
MKWIEKVLEIKPFEIKTLWNDGNIRNIDFQPFLESKGKKVNSSYHQLLNKDVFVKAQCDGTTIFWQDLIEYKNLDGRICKGNLDISPEVLYELAQH